MEESILKSMRELLVGDSSDTSFDKDITMHINTVLNVLYQLGVGSNDFIVTGIESKWEDLLEDNTSLELVKTYMYLKIRKIFDPPQSSTAMDSLNSSINELEWRINVMVDPESDDD